MAQYLTFGSTFRLKRNLEGNWNAGVLNTVTGFSSVAFDAFGGTEGRGALRVHFTFKVGYGEALMAPYGLRMRTPRKESV